MKISFLQNVRGYGGVAILWSKCIDPLVKVFKEGNSRIQCIELKTNIPILCISTYLPTKVENDRYEEYSECIDQIFEIIQKYQNSHEIVIGGDFNEDISKNMYLIIIQLNLSLSVR
jgi:exonuclease III